MNYPNQNALSVQSEECAGILVSVGVKRNIARVLVFFITTQEATSRDIEQATGLRQPEVSLALQYLAGRHWVDVRAGTASGNGRPNRVYTLSRPLDEIMDAIQAETEREIENRLSVIAKLRDHVP